MAINNRLIRLIN